MADEQAKQHNERDESGKGSYRQSTLHDFWKKAPETLVDSDSEQREDEEVTTRQIDVDAELGKYDEAASIHFIHDASQGSGKEDAEGQIPSNTEQAISNDEADSINGSCIEQVGAEEVQDQQSRSDADQDDTEQTKDRHNTSVIEHEEIDEKAGDENTSSIEQRESEEVPNSSSSSDVERGGIPTKPSHCFRRLLALFHRCKVGGKENEPHDSTRLMREIGYLGDDPNLIEMSDDNRRQKGHIRTAVLVEETKYQREVIFPRFKAWNDWQVGVDNSPFCAFWRSLARHCAPECPSEDEIKIMLRIHFPPFCRRKVNIVDMSTNNLTEYEAHLGSLPHGEPAHPHVTEKLEINVRKEISKADRAGFRWMYALAL